MTIDDMEKLSRRTTSGQVVVVLREKILSGELPPGTPLREVALAGSLGVSRNTLREALRSLERDGLVRHVPHRGVTVSVLEDHDIVEIYRARYAIESAAVPRLVELVDLQEVEALIEEMEAASKAGDWVAVVEADMRFHTWIVEQLGNKRLADFVEGLWGELRIGLMLADRAVGTEGIAEQHMRLVDLMRDGDTDALRRELEDHLRESEERVREILGQASG